MGGPRAVGAAVDGISCVAGVVHWDRRQSHKRAIARGHCFSGPGVRVTRVLETLKSASYGETNVKAVSHGGQVATMPPTDVAPHLVHWVKPASFYQACGQTQSHGSVISPLPGFQAKGSTYD